MIICKKCNSTLPNDAKFCTSCGSEIERAGEAATITPKDTQKSKKPIIFGATGIIIIALVLFAVFFFKDGGNVKFSILPEELYPGQITYEIIPEYKQMERAIACVVDDKIYVIATRGEKSTAGYEIAIDKMKLTKDGDTTKLLVHCEFTDPDPNMALAQTLSYPYQVAEVQLDALPYEVELEVKYVD